MNLNIATMLGESTDSFEKIMASSRNIHSSQESFNTSLRNVLDLFIRTGNVLKDTVTRWNRSLKRSEMEKYSNDHTLILKAIDRLPYDKVKDVDVDIPFGMQGRYIDAIKALRQIFKDLEPASMMDITFNEFKQIRADALAGDNISEKVEDLKSTLSVKDTVVNNGTETLNKIFTTSDRSDKKFSAVFSTMGEFKDCRSECIETEIYLQQADRLHKRADDLSAAVTDITALRDKEIPKEMSDSLSDSAYKMARILDMYGNCCLNLMSISHNLTLVCNTLYQVVK